MTRFERSLIIISTRYAVRRAYLQPCDLVSEGVVGYVVAEREVTSAAQTGDTASVRVTIGPESTSRRLEQRGERFRRGGSKPRPLDGSQEVLYVVSGRGRLHLGGRVYDLEPDLGAYVASGETYEVENDAAEELVLVCVRAPEEARGR